MRINLITLNRHPNNYINNTIESLKQSDWSEFRYCVTLCAGSDDISHIQNSEFDILPWREETPKEKRVGFCLNYVRALRHGFGDVVILEDDILLCPKWMEELHKAIAEINLDRYVLALYSPINLSNECFDRGKHYRSYFAPSFFGTQAMYYPESVRYEIADFIYANRYRKPGDLLISEWANTNNCLYALQGSVAQHMGKISTGVAGCDHSAWNLMCTI